MPGDFWGEEGTGKGREWVEEGLESELVLEEGAETVTRRSTICSESSVRSSSAEDAEEDERRPGL